MAEFSQSQFLAVKLAASFGKTIVEEHSTAAMLWRKGLTYQQIDEELDLSRQIGVEPRYLRFCLNKAFTGHDGSFGVDAYEGLIPDAKERKSIAQDHEWENALSSYENGTGIFGMSAEDLHAARVKGGQVQGATQVRDGTGIMGRSKSQRLEDSLIAVISRGETPWVRIGDPFPDGSYCCMSEAGMAKYLSQQEGFQRGSRVDNKALAARVNELYHQGENVRQADDVRVKLYRLRTGKEQA